jgi:GxxExxY protein
MDDKTTIRIVQEPKRQELVQICYDIIGCIFEVYKQLGAGLPEYIYQEALYTELTAAGLTTHKELEYHPMYKGTKMKAYLKMDLVVESPIGNIIIECKALTQLTEREHYQTFGYLRGTGWPIAILVNFGSSPRAQIERYYNNDGIIELF